MLPARLLKDKFWLLFAIAILILVGTIPVFALGIDAESHSSFAYAFIVIWSVLMAGMGLVFYGMARKNPQVASVIMVVALSSLSLFYRAPSAFVEPQFIAEDACVFFVQQRDIGWHAFVTPYNGYYHAIVRIIAEVTAYFPVLFVPALYSLCWLGIYALVIAYILIQYPDRKWAPIVALVPAFISHTCEIFMVATNAIWLGGLALTAFLLLPVPQITGWRRYLLSCVLLVFSVSGPFSLILSPFYILRWIFDRKNFPLVYLLAVTIGAFIQLMVLHSYYANKHTSTAWDASNLLLSFKVAMLRIPWSLAVGYQPYEFYWLFIVIPFFVLLGFMAWEIKSNLKKQMFPLGCLVLCGTYVAMDFLRISPLEALVPLVNGDRYFYIPKVLFVWALVHLAVTSRNRKPFVIALCLCALGSMTEFTNTTPDADYHWPKYAAMIDEGSSVIVPVNPGWSAYVQNKTAPK